MFREVLGSCALGDARASSLDLCACYELFVPVSSISHVGTSCCGAGACCLRLLCVVSCRCHHVSHELTNDPNISAVSCHIWYFSCGVDCVGADSTDRHRRCVAGHRHGCDGSSCAARRSFITARMVGRHPWMGGYCGRCHRNFHLLSRVIAQQRHLNARHIDAGEGMVYLTGILMLDRF